MVSISTPWTGTAKVYQGLLLGDNVGIVYTKSLDWRKLERTYNSVISLSPSAPKWSSKTPIILTKLKNYTVDDADEFMTSLNVPNMSLRWNAVKGFIQNLTIPAVPTLCIYGGGKKLQVLSTTAKQIIQTVHQKLYTKLAIRAQFRQYDNEGHVEILKNEKMIKFIHSYMNLQFTRKQKVQKKNVNFNRYNQTYENHSNTDHEAGMNKFKQDLKKIKQTSYEMNQILNQNKGKQIYIFKKKSKNVSNKVNKNDDKINVVSNDIKITSEIDSSTRSASASSKESLKYNYDGSLCTRYVHRPKEKESKDYNNDKNYFT
ncbi:hypothetical protein A3Q56_07274 [Intoshia linei]|uniref:Uncharacterized protein n=1 Tax=Intoshia linei TaxID=1819745 RepID=A0A177ASK8_9BILA|nr:hypothetical protein A3Q56_07274 [Intoshia linei]